MQTDNEISLDFLGEEVTKWLYKLAKLNGRTPVEELKDLVRRRVFGHLKDLGDDRGSFRLYEDGPTPVKVDVAEFRK